MIKAKGGIRIVKVLVPIAIATIICFSATITLKNYNDRDKVSISLNRLNVRSKLTSNFISRSEENANYLSSNYGQQSDIHHGYVEYFPENAELMLLSVKEIFGNDTIALRYHGLLNKQLFQCGHDTSSAEAPIESLFFVSKNSQLVCCPIQKGQPDFHRFEVLIEGVEALKIRYGQDNNHDGIVNQYVSPNQNLILSQILDIKISMLIRSLSKEKDVLNTKYYTLQDVELGPYSDDIHRMVFTITLPLNHETSGNI